MAEKLTAIRLKTNPKRKAKRKKAPAPGRITRAKTRTKRARKTRGGFVVEVMREKKGSYSFCYVRGGKLVHTKAQAARYASAKLATTAAHGAIKKLTADYKLARVVPA